MVIQDGCRPGLETETAAKVGIPEPPRGDHLQGDVAPQPRVAAPINLPHSSHPEECLDLVRTEPFSRLKCHEADRRMISRGMPDPSLWLRLRGRCRAPPGLSI